jgi:hypothetical protein
MGRSLPSVVVAVTLVGALAACAHENDSDNERAEPAPSYSAIPVPPRPMTGTLDAVLRQSSRDAARGRMQVWIFNGTENDVQPTDIEYVDSRLSQPIVGQRVRSMPSGLERGFPLPLAGPHCGQVGQDPPVAVVDTPDGTERLPVADSIGIVQRYVDATCFEQAVRRVVDLHWDDVVPATDDVGTLTLVATPTGRPGTLQVLSVGSTPVLAPAPGGPWRPGTTITGDGEEQRIELSTIPARCDSHAFFEAGGATAFRVRLSLDGQVGELVLRMSTAGAQAAIAYAIEICDF